MSPEPRLIIDRHFASISDPRNGNATQHELIDILVIAVCAVISGADNWVEIELWGQAQQAWLETFLALPNGIPSHDTIGRVFARLDPAQFRECFLSWVSAISKLSQGQVVAIDGKKLRRSHNRRSGKDAIWMVSAWATANRLVLGQVKTKGKSNEIKAIPELLRVLELKDCIVTIDAIGCQTKIVAQIAEKQGDYVLSVKDNQGQLHQDLKDLFAGCQEVNYRQVPHGYTRTVNKGHGRIEIRQCWTLSAPEFLEYIRRRESWKNLRTVVMVQAEREVNGKRSRQVRYYISSLENNPKLILNAVRAHGGVENGLHWVLDIAFREDDSRVRKDHAPENFAILRHIAVNLLKQETTTRVGIKAKRFKAACDRNYLLQILSIG